MKIRTRLGLLLLECSRLLRASLPLLLSPKALVELNQIQFSEQSSYWIESAKEGFFEPELELLDTLSLKPGNILCLGAGAGREAFAFARRGFQVTGVDQCVDLIEYAADFARKNRMAIEFLNQDITQLDLDGRRFDYALLFNTCYSFIPSKELRIRLLGRIVNLLNPAGQCIVNFLVQEPQPLEQKIYPWLKGLARLAGNRGFEIGDRVTEHRQFIHYFSSPEEVVQEGGLAGFADSKILTPQGVPYVVFSKGNENFFNRTSVG